VRLDDVKNAYETLSGIASQIVRQLSLAGIGLIWLFNIGSGAKPALPHPLLQGALFIFLALFFDLLQYLLGTFTWFLYFRKKERAGTPPDREFLAPRLDQLANLVFIQREGCVYADRLPGLHPAISLHHIFRYVDRLRGTNCNPFLLRRIAEAYSGSNSARRSRVPYTTRSTLTASPVTRNRIT